MVSFPNRGRAGAVETTDEDRANMMDLYSAEGFFRCSDLQWSPLPLIPSLSNATESTTTSKKTREMQL